jgi:hypothetical protein
MLRLYVLRTERDKATRMHRYCCLMFRNWLVLCFPANLFAHFHWLKPKPSCTHQVRAEAKPKLVTVKNKLHPHAIPHVILADVPNFCTSSASITLNTHSRAAPSLQPIAPVKVEGRHAIDCLQNPPSQPPS